MYYASKRYPHLRRHDGEIRIQYGQDTLESSAEYFLVRYVPQRKQFMILEWIDAIECYSSTRPQRRPQSEIECLLTDADKLASVVPGRSGPYGKVFPGESLESRAKVTVRR